MCSNQQCKANFQISTSLKYKTCFFRQSPELKYLKEWQITESQIKTTNSCMICNRSSNVLSRYTQAPSLLTANILTQSVWEMKLCSKAWRVGRGKAHSFFCRSSAAPAFFIARNFARTDALQTISFKDKPARDNWKEWNQVASQGIN